MKRNLFKKIRLSKSKSSKKLNKQIFESLPLNINYPKNTFKKNSRKK